MLPAEPTPAERDAQVVRLAIEQGLVDEDTLLWVQTERGDDEAELPLGQLLVRRRLLGAQSYLELNRLVGGGGDAPPGERPAGMPPRLGPYEIVAEIGRGGMGVIFRARDPKLRREVAIKLLHAADAADAVAVERFQREAQAAGSLQHPHIVAVHEVGTSELGPWFAMELVRGQTLDVYLATRRPERWTLIDLLIKVCQAVQHAHERGIIHRDLKPANILVTDEGAPKITDFGLAKLMGRQTMLTHTGLAMGTPFYMPPEQVRGQAKDVDARSDVYALGVILYQLISGALPFQADTQVELFQKILETDPLPPRHHQADIPCELETICLKAMRKAPPDRYASARELADDLGRFQAGEAIRARPEGRLRRWRRWAARPRQALRLVLALGALGLLVLGAGMAGWSWREERTARAEALAGLRLEEPETAAFAARWGRHVPLILREALRPGQPPQVFMRAARLAADLKRVELAEAVAAAGKASQGLAAAVLRDQNLRLQGLPRLPWLAATLRSGDVEQRRYALAILEGLTEDGLPGELLPLLLEADLADELGRLVARRWPEAVADLKDGIKQDLGEGRPEAALVRIQMAAVIAPGDEDWPILESEAHGVRKDWARQVETLEAAQERGDSTERLRRSLEQARQSLARFDLEETRVILERDGGNPEAHRRRAQAYGVLGEYARALEHWRRVRAVEDSAEAATAEMRCGQALGRYEQAQRLFEEAQALDGSYAPVWAARAEVRRRLGDLRGARADYDQALIRCADDYELRIARSGFLLELGDFQIALDDARAAAALRPRYAQPQLLQARAQEGAGDPAAAQRAYAQALRLDPSVEAYLGRARLALAERPPRADEAIADLEAARALSPGNREVEFQLARACLAAGRRDEAWAGFRAVARDGDSPWVARAQLELAEGARAAGQVTQAIAAVGAAMDRAMDYEAYRLASELRRGLQDDLRRQLLRLRDRDEAGRLLRELVDSAGLREVMQATWEATLQEQRQAIRTHIGRVAPGLGLAGLHAATQVVSKDPKLAARLLVLGEVLGAPVDDILLLRGTLEAARGEVETAIASFSELIRLRPGTDQPYERRVSCYLLLGRHDEALADCQRLIDLNPRDPAQYIKRGQTLMQLERAAEAVADLERARRLGRSLDLELVYAEALVDAGRHEEAIAVLDELIAVQPQNAAAWLLRGRAHLSCRRPRTAATDFTAAVALEPANLEPLALRGWAELLRGGRQAQAERDFRSAMGDPRLGGLWGALGLGMLALERGDPVEAWRYHLPIFITERIGDVGGDLKPELQVIPGEGASFSFALRFKATRFPRPIRERAAKGAERIVADFRRRYMQGRAVDAEVIAHPLGLLLYLETLAREGRAALSEALSEGTALLLLHPAQPLPQHLRLLEERVQEAEGAREVVYQLDRYFLRRLGGLWPELRLMRARALCNMGRPAAALPSLDRAIADLAQKGRPAVELAPYHFLRGRILGRLGRTAEAADACGRALAGSPGDAAILGYSAQTRYEAGDAAGALADLERLGGLRQRVLPRDGQPPLRLDELRGRCLFRLGRYGEAAQAFADAGRVDGGSEELRIALARALWLDGKLERAAAVFEELKPATRSSAAALELEGLLLLGRDRRAEAERLSLRLIRLDGQRAQGYLLLARLAERGGDHAAALGFIETALREGLSWDALETDPTLAPLRGDGGWRRLRESYRKS